MEAVKCTKTRINDRGKIAFIWEFDPLPKVLFDPSDSQPRAAAPHLLRISEAIDNEGRKNPGFMGEAHDGKNADT